MSYFVTWVVRDAFIQGQTKLAGYSFLLARMIDILPRLHPSDVSSVDVFCFFTDVRHCVTDLQGTHLFFARMIEMFTDI